MNEVECRMSVDELPSKTDFLFLRKSNNLLLYYFNSAYQKSIIFHVHSDRQSRLLLFIVCVTTNIDFYYCF